MSIAPSTALAFGFLNPLLAGGLALAALPVIIHLLSRRRYRQIDWGATLFLLQADKESRRRTRFEQWLLLLLRCLAMALIGLLVARPFIQPGLIAALVGGSNPAQRIVLIDDSASLGFREGGRPELDRLTQAADRLASWLGQAAAGERLVCFLTSEPGKPWLELERLDAAGLAHARQRLAGLTPSHVPANPRRALERVVEQIRAADGARRTDVYVLSDFQRSDWLAGAGESSVFESLQALETGSVRVIMIASGLQRRENLAITALRLERAQAVAGLPVILHATVANYAPRASQPLQLELDLAETALPAIELAPLAPGELRSVTAEVTFNEPGFAEVRAALSGGDGLASDNARRLTVAARPALSVLLVNGAPATDPQRDEVHLLRNALAPPGPFSSGIELRVIDAGDLESTPLDDHDVVALCNVATPSESAAAALDRYVRRGGGLLVFLGDQVGDPGEYNRVLYAAGNGPLPAPLEDLRRSRDGVWLIRTAEHPVTAMFPAGGATLSEEVRFRTYYGCAPPAGVDASQPAAPPAQILARYTDAAGSAALVERVHGQGRVLLFTSSADLDWNGWARSMDGSYVVTMLETVQYLARRDRQRTVFDAGESLVVSVDPEHFEPLVVFRSPDYPADQPVEVRPSAESLGPGEPLRFEGPVATRLGAYGVELTHREHGAQQRTLSVNLAARESDLATAGDADLHAAVADLPHEILNAEDAFLQAGDQARRELWRLLLLLSVATLMGEQALACWFGTPKRAARSSAARQGLLGRILSWKPPTAPTRTR